jgi:hypothetical protein
VATRADWTCANQVKATVQRHWDSGRLLSTRVPGHENPVFPMRVPLRRPSSGDLLRHWDDVRAWVESLSAAPGFRLQSEPVNHRTLGTQTIPVAAWFDTADQALSLIRRTRDAARFDALVEATDPVNLDWVARHPLRLLEIGDDWPAVQAVATWLRQNPTPGIFIRQVEIAGVHTKVIETHKRTIADLVPGTPTSGSAWFERRYGLLTNPSLVRFRVLDHGLCVIPGVAEMALPVAEFVRLCPPASTVFVTENLTNYLSFPHAPKSIVVFGSGNEAPELLAATTAVRSARLFYTGDLDTHGFAILDRFRATLPHTESLLMDMQTLLGHRPLWVTEKTQITRDLTHLRADEAEVFDTLRSNRLGEHVRLEQERIAFTRVRDAVAAATSAYCDLLNTE